MDIENVIMAWFASNKKLDYSSIADKIKNIAFSGKDIDLETSREKLLLLRQLKEEIEQSGVLNGGGDGAHLIIQTIYSVLFKAQEGFSKSYYATLSEAVSNASSYKETVLPYENHISSIIKSIQPLANNISKTEAQRGMFANWKKTRGLLKAAVFALMIGFTGCDVEIHYNKLHAAGYSFNVDQSDVYLVKDDQSINNLKFGTLLNTVASHYKLDNGEEGEGQQEVYDFDGNGSHDLMTFRTDDGKIISVLLIKNSPAYNRIKKLLGNRVKHHKFDSTIHLGF